MVPHDVRSVYDLDDPAKAKAFLEAVGKYFGDGFSRAATGIVVAGTYDANVFNKWLVAASQSSRLPIPPERRM